MSQWKANLAVLWFGQFLIMSGMTMVLPFLPLFLQAELGVNDPSKVAWWSNLIFAGTFVTSFIFQPIWGGLADRTGRKIMLLRSGFCMGIVMILMGLATNAWQLLILRLINGVFAGYIPAATALMATTAPRDKVGFAMGTLQSGAVAGTILGPFFGGLLAEWVGYRPIFYITGSLLVAASLLAWIVVKEDFQRKKAPSGPKVSMVSNFREIVSKNPILALFSVTASVQISLQSSMMLIPIFVQEIHGMERIAFFAGLVSAVTGFSNMLASPLLGRLSDRIGPEKVLAYSMVGAAIAFIPQMFVVNIWQLLISRFCLGMFMGGLLPSVHALLKKHAPSGMDSRVFGFNSSFMAMGNILGPLSGAVLASFFGIRGIFLFACVLLLTVAFWIRASLRGKETKAVSGSSTL